MSELKGHRTAAVKLKSNKKRKNSSRLWLARQLRDPYVIKSQLEGYRSRAAYKLLDINEKFKLFKPGQIVIDLGAAPGGWCQILTKLLNSSNNSSSKIIALDLLAIELMPGVIMVQQDFTDPEAIILINSFLENRKVDAVISDMAANTIGHSTTDHMRIIDLCHQALNFAIDILKPGGIFVAKIFQGGAEQDVLKLAKSNFKRVKHFKPQSSRLDSTEMYLIATEFKGKKSVKIISK